MIEDKQLPFPIKDFRKQWYTALRNSGINKPGGTRRELYLPRPAKLLRKRVIPPEHESACSSESVCSREYEHNDYLRSHRCRTYVGSCKATRYFRGKCRARKYRHSGVETRSVELGTVRVLVSFVHLDKVSFSSKPSSDQLRMSLKLIQLHIPL